MQPEIDYRLYLVTDRELTSASSLETAVEQAIKGGCTLVQLREKKCSSLDFYYAALKMKEITDFYHIPLIINDRLDIALSVNAAGVHIGQSDLPAIVARRIIGQDKLLGVSAATLNEAIKAQKDGADYLGVGAMYYTGTKTDARTVSIAELKEIKRGTAIPVVAIGGINESRVQEVMSAGIDGIAVVSAILAQEDIFGAASRLKAMIN